MNAKELYAQDVLYTENKSDKYFHFRQFHYGWLFIKNNEIVARGEKSIWTHEPKDFWKILKFWNITHSQWVYYPLYK